MPYFQPSRYGDLALKSRGFGPKVGGFLSKSKPIVILNYANI
jgi:hypothetical protein